MPIINNSNDRLNTILESFNIHQQIYAISTFEHVIEDYTAVAVGCKSSIYIFKLYPNGFNNNNNNNNNPLIIRLSVDVITDISWSPNAIIDGKIAISFTNGSVTVLTINLYNNNININNNNANNINNNNINTNNNYKKEWESNSNDFIRSVNKIMWQKNVNNNNNNNRNVINNYKLLCSCQDGSIKLFDLKNILELKDIDNNNNNNNNIKDKENNIIETITYSLIGAEGCRDIKFSPIFNNLFASVYENGMLALWSTTEKGEHNNNNNNNNSVVTKPLCKIGAHTKSIMSLDWHPTCDHMLATGGKDGDQSGIFKIWTIKDIDSDHPLITLLYQIYWNAPITKVSWRGINNNNNNNNIEMSKFTYHIATCSYNSMGAISSIALWDVTKPHIPIMVLYGYQLYSLLQTLNNENNEGNAASIIMGFEWLDTPMTLSQNNIENKKNILSLPTNLNLNLNLNMHLLNTNKPKRTLMNVFQHIIGFTKQGSIFIYDLRNGYFPRQHMSTAISTISCQGIIASHCGYLYKDNIFSFVSNTDTESTLGFYADKPKLFGMKFNNDIENITLQEFNKEIKPHSIFIAEWNMNIAIKHNLQVIQSLNKDDILNNNNNNNNNNLDEDKIIIDLSSKYIQGSLHNGFHHNASKKNIEKHLLQISNNNNNNTNNNNTNNNNEIDNNKINSLLINKQIQTILEYDPCFNGDPFETTLIILFAKYYKSTFLPINIQNMNTIEKIETAIKLCIWNYNVTETVNCNCRSKLWSSLIMLLPMLSTYLLSSDKKENFINENIELTFSPYILSTIQSLLIELLDLGDVQHVYYCYEIFKFCNLSSFIISTSINSNNNNNNNKLNIPETRIKEAYVCYIELLQKLGLYTEANIIIKSSTDKYFMDLSRSGTTYDTSCGSCNKELLSLSSSNAIPAWCQKCNISMAKCCICYKTIKGLMHWCPVCSHSAHYDCYQEWFATGEILCPTGCGHQCSVII